MEAILEALRQFVERHGILKLALGAMAAMWIAWLLLLHVLLLRPASTDRRLLRGRWRAPARRVRSRMLRLGAALTGWPFHLLAVFGIHPRGGMSSGGAAWVHGPTGPRLIAPGWAVDRAPEFDADRTPVLLVHAVVTRPWILDLTPEQSLVATLRRGSRAVFVLDWGDPGPEDHARDLSWCVEQVLLAEAHVRDVTGAERVHLVGYCSGGTVALLRAAHQPDGHLAAVAAVAAPVDFHVPGGMAAVIRPPDLHPAWLLDEHGLVPAPVVRESFHLLRPRALRTVLTRLRLRRAGVDAASTDALAAWLWYQRDLPGALLFDLVELVRSNGLLAGTFRVDGRVVDLRRIGAPVGVFQAARDHLVPAGSSAALAAVAGVDCHVVTCSGGHIGMVLGTVGEPSLHDVLPAWLAEHDVVVRDVVS